MLKLTKTERTALQQQAAARADSADSARHAKLILLLDDGFSWAEIRARLRCSDSYIARWSKRFNAERLAGLYSKHAGRARYKVTDRLESRVLTRTTKHMPADGSGQWSSRKLAAELGGAISHTTVARIWAKHGISPQRRDNDPSPDLRSFDAKAADVIGLYLNPPQHAAIFSIDDTDARAAERVEDKPARATRHHAVHDHDGVHALYKALKSRSIHAVEAPPATRQTSAELAAFVAAIAASQPTDKEIHVIADNPPASKTRALATLMANHPNLHMQFMANHAAWLNQVEESLTEMECGEDSADDGKPPAHLEQKLMRYLRRRSQRVRSIKWKHVETRDDRP